MLAYIGLYVCLFNTTAVCLLHVRKLGGSSNYWQCPHPV